MGKIFKALEKAEKQTTRSPASKRVAQEVKKQLVAAENRPPLRQESKQSDKSEHKTKVNRVERQMEVAAPAIPKEKETAIAPARETVHRSLPAQAIQAQPDALARPKSQPHAEEQPISAAPAENATAHAASATPDPIPSSKGANLTLFKQEAEETADSAQAAVQMQKADKPTVKRVEVRYSRTKVQRNDPAKLIDNKIFSVLDDIETTDQIKILRTQVLRKLKAMGGNSILVTSANPYEGKTFTSINLGVSIAKEFDRTVLIIDADIRKPTERHTAFSTQFFSLDVEKGLTDYLMGDVDISDILINPGIEKLTLIPGGLPVNNSPELLNSARMETMMAEIKSRYASDRIVILDGPALLPFPDAVILSKYVDGVLPVVEAEKTSVDDLKKMMGQLKEVPILGTVLNKNRE